MRFEIKYDPLPTQKRFHNSQAKFRLFAGGMGSGKSLCGAAEAIQLSLEYSKNLGLVGRATYPELRDTTRKELLDFPVVVDGKEMPFISSPVVKSFNKSENTLTLKNGSEIVFRSLEDSFHKIKSLNLGWFWIDELTETTEDIWLGLVGRLRRKACRHTGFGTTNPEGRDWVWKRFIAQPDNDHFVVHAKTPDNTYLPPGYVQSLLDQFPEEWIKRYVYGSFDTFEGLVYKEFSDRAPHVIQPYELDSGWYRFVSLDHGFRNPTAVLWFAVSPSGNVFVYDEFYSSGKLVSELSEIIKAKTGKDKIQQWLIDPSCSNRDGKTGRSIIDEFSDHGIYFTPANNEVRAGINHVSEYLKLNNGKPKMRIFINCQNLRRELQTYRWKDIKPGATQNEPDKPQKKDDHACFVAGTMIRLAGGEMEIERVERGDYVKTRNGFSKVIKSEKMGEKEVFEYDINGHKLIATPDHPIFTLNRGWVRISSLTLKDIVCILEQKGEVQCQSLSSLTGINTAGNQISDTSAEAADVDTYIATYGEQHSGKSQTGITFTTSTGIPVITTYLISARLRDEITYRNIQESISKKQRNNLSSIWKRFVLSLSRGIVPPKVESGIEITASKRSKKESRYNSSVRSAAKNLNPSSAGKSGSVPITVRVQIVARLMWMMLKEIAGLVVNSFSRTNTLAQNSAQEVARIPTRSLGVKPTYNLLTTSGEYFANGVLCHNCDSLRYGVNYIYNTPNLKPQVKGWKKWIFGDYDPNLPAPVGEHWMAE